MDFSKIAEDKIKEAIKKNEFENLPGMGQPLEIKDNFPGMSDEWKMAYRVLNNAGYSPEDVKKEILRMEELLEGAVNDEQKERLQSKLMKKRLEMERLLEKRGTASNSRFGSYADKIYKKLK